MQHYIKISPLRTAKLLALAALVLLLIHLFTELSRYNDFSFPLKFHFYNVFLLGKESSIPTWFSSFEFLFASFLLFIIGSIKKAEKDRFASGWQSLSIIFLYLSVDETAVLHEKLGGLVNDFANISVLTYYGWIIPGIILVGIFVVSYYRFLLNLPSDTRIQFIIAGITFITGAILMESLALPYENGRAPDMIFSLLVGIEEMLEMAGLIIFIYALLSYLRAYQMELIAPGDML